MKYMKFAASVAAKFFIAALMAVVGVSCSDQLLETQAVNPGTQDLVQTQDFDGYSVGTITNKEKHFLFGARIELGFKRIPLEDTSIMGKIDAVKPTNPSISDFSENGFVGEIMTRNFNFQKDGQTAVITVQWGVDSAATDHYEPIDAYYVDYTSSKLDDEGEVYQLGPHFAIDFVHTSDPTLSGTMNLSPRYLHILKGAEIEDSLIIHTSDYEGHSDGSATNVLGTGSAEIALTLGSNQVIVEESQFGKLSLKEEGEPSSSDISTTTQKGERTVKKFTFDDGQTATAIYQYLYQLAAENHVAITSVKYRDYTATKTGDSTYQIRQHYVVNYQRTGNKTESGSFDLYPWYTQKLKYTAPTPTEPTYIYEVDEKYTDSEANSVKMRNLNVKIYKKDKATGETVANWRLRWTVVTSGHIVGRDTVYVSGVNIVDHDFTDQELTSEPYHYENKPIEDNPMFLETLSSHTYRCEAFAPADGGGKSVMGGQLLYQTSIITFKEGDFTWKSKEFVKSVDRSDEQMVDDPSRVGKTCKASDRTYKYGKTHKITAHNYLDGELWFSSTATSHLWVLQP